MAKRQVESKIFEEVWFMDLAIEYKALMLYFFITSSHAGLGNLNMKLINATLNHEYDKEHMFIFLGNQIREYKPDKYEIKGYMKFHYSDDNKSQIHKSAIKERTREGLIMSKEDQEFEKFSKRGMVSDDILTKIGGGF
jgi:hypothetical protein